MKLEVGMYVRTTYGIGRIVNAYIVYDDCGGLWHLSYMTDNPKIEVSIYTKNDSWELFGEVQKDHRIKYEPLENDFDLVKKVYEQELEEIVCYVPVNKSYPRNASLYDDHKFIKVSYNIIDILEVGDYVNGYKVEKVNNNLSEHKGICNSLDTYLWGINDLDEFEKIVIFENDIKSVVTKEEFESMKYRIEDE